MVWAHMSLTSHNCITVAFTCGDEVPHPVNGDLTKSILIYSRILYKIIIHKKAFSFNNWFCLSANIITLADENLLHHLEGNWLVLITNSHQQK